MAKRAIDNEYKKEIEAARLDLIELIKTNNCAPILLRLSFHDAGNYNAITKTGGANGSIRLPVENSNPANNGIIVGVNFCDQIKTKHPIVTFADIYQLAGVVAVEVTGGPIINFVPGRKDTEVPDVVRLPSPNSGPARLREVFYVMGMSDKDIVAISGAHALGGAKKQNSGFEGPFTADPLTFDNSYYRNLLEGDTKGLLQLPSDKALVEDPIFKKYVTIYAECQETFFKDYAETHKKMSELGFIHFKVANNLAIPK